MDTSKITTAWRGHERFAWWLAQTLDPKVTADLGIDEGYSTIELARYNKGHVFGIDWFQGDAQAGWGNKEAIARKNVADSGFQNITILKETFQEASQRFQNGEVDLCHIDGAHGYDDVKRDFETWFPKVRSGGVFLLHDVEAFAQDVGRFYHELALPKFYFTHSAGLGVVTKP